MNNQLENLLFQYWGHKNFRSLQKDIIESVIAKRDTLALLPTGGGKSICFQIPGLALPGITLVISPLIALIKDQVETLNNKGIKAVSIVSGMSHREIDITLDNCIYSDIKFLFISPERIANELFQERVKKMKVNLIAVDEAHCISQWGYDFRPSYLNIVQLRELLPAVKIIALTASATPEVQLDIVEKLQFHNEAIFKKSFERKNLEYLILEEDSKYNRTLSILNKTPGTAVVYVRNRKQTKEISDWLNVNQISADYYHAGLDANLRSEKQDLWMNGTTRVMVSTNAFGMGIDKADVRVVIHFDLPDSLEAYYQEAGRAGRDEKRSFAILLFTEMDISELKRKYLSEYPTLMEIKQVYDLIMNHFQLAYGAGINQQFEFDIDEFIKKTNFSVIKLSHSFNFLQREKYFILSDNLFQPSKINIRISQTELLHFQENHPKFEPLLKIILRSYSGLFENYIPIHENDLAKRVGLNTSELIQMLLQLVDYQIIDYVPKSSKPSIQFITNRLPQSNLYIDPTYYQSRLANVTNKINSMIDFIKKKTCRSIQLRQYFGEDNAEKCGHCDVCRAELANFKKENALFERISMILKNEPLYLPALLSKIKDLPEKLVLESIQIYVEEGLIQFNDKNEVIISKTKPK